MVEASPQRANMGFIGAIVAVATIGGFLFGYDSGAVNGTQDGLTQAFGLVPGSWSPSNGLGFTVASLLIGCFIGAFFAGRLADIMGRRNTLMVAAALFLGGALVQGFSHSHIVFLIARICGGMAVGAASVLSPAYISEVAPAEIRGRLTTVQQIMIITGLTAAFVVNKFLALGAFPVTGQLTGNLKLQGPKSALEGAGTVTVTNGSIYGEAVTQASANIAFTKGTVKATNINVTSPAGTATGQAELNLNTNQFNYSIQSSSIDLSKLKVLSSLAGLLGGNLTIRLGARQPERFGKLAAWAPAGAWDPHVVWPHLLRMLPWKLVFWPALRLQHLLRKWVIK